MVHYLIVSSRTRSGGTGNHKGIRYFLSFLFSSLAFFFCDKPGLERIAQG